MDYKLPILSDSLKELSLYSLFIQQPILFSKKLCRIEHNCNDRYIFLDINSKNEFDNMRLHFVQI